MDKDFLNVITIRETDTIGSSADPKVRFKTDIDMQEFVEYSTDSSVDAFEEIRRFFLGIFEHCAQSLTCIITDFKMGVWGANVPVRWTYDDVKRGYVDIDAMNRKTFVDLLNMRSIIKMDFLLIDSDFKLREVSKNFYFIFADFETIPLQMIYEDMAVSLLKDYYKYRNDGKRYKSLKRLYSYYKLTDNKQGQSRVLRQINSPKDAVPYIREYKKELIDTYMQHVKLKPETKKKLIEANTV